LPHYAPPNAKGMQTFYLMLDENGASELSRPIVKGGTFSAFIERIYLGNVEGDDLDGSKLPLDDNDVADSFDPQVVRK
jgi:hypothetical protein